MKQLIIIVLASMALASCTPTAQQKKADIDKLQNDIIAKTKNNIADTIAVKKLLAEYDSYIKAFPKDSMCPVYLIKSAAFYSQVKLPAKAADYYHQVYTNFPNYNGADFAMFSEGFIYANDLHDLSKARDIYNSYITRFPNSKWVKSAQFELENLGKPVEEIIKSLTDSTKTASADTKAH
jgi:outer membrane protein assembly factor BamD (BamD/ComL family)